jgi:Domain of unknown function (DUF4349)
MRKLIVIAFIGLLALGGLACTSGGDDEAGAGAAADVSGGDSAVAEEGGGEAVPVSQPSQGGGSVPSVGPRIVQTASLSLSVPRREFDSTIQHARTIATGSGGFVVSSSASQGTERRLVRGTLVVRIPERAYARVIDQLSGLGRVEGREEAGQDVSQEAVDLEARIRHLEAVEAQLLGFLEDAENVSAALAVQAELNRVQLELEQARGRLQYLDDQVAFATISLEVRERQAQVAAAGDGGPWSIADAWSDAATGFVTVVGWILVAAATIAPVALLLLLAFFAARLAGVRRLPGIRRPQS